MRKLSISSLILLWRQRRLYLHANINLSTRLPAPVTAGLQHISLSLFLPFHTNLAKAPAHHLCCQCPLEKGPQDANHLNHLGVSSPQAWSFSVGSGGSEGRRASSSVSVSSLQWRQLLRGLGLWILRATSRLVGELGTCSLFFSFQVLTQNKHPSTPTPNTGVSANGFQGLGTWSRHPWATSFQPLT